MNSFGGQVVVSCVNGTAAVRSTPASARSSCLRTGEVSRRGARSGRSTGPCMRFERDCDEFTVALCLTGDRQQVLVAEMDAVEIADDHHGMRRSSGAQAHRTHTFRHRASLAQPPWAATAAEFTCVQTVVLSAYRYRRCPQGMVGGSEYRARKVPSGSNTASGCGPLRMPGSDRRSSSGRARPTRTSAGPLRRRGLER